jgi:hypothetical protein
MVTYLNGCSMALLQIATHADAALPQQHRWAIDFLPASSIQSKGN